MSPSLAPASASNAPSDEGNRMHAPLSAARLNFMRGAYILMTLGIMVFKWPLLLQAASMPAAETANLCIVTAMSLLWLLGLRYPTGMLPVMLFEVIWKLLWIAIVGVPHLLTDTMDAANESMLFSVILVVPLLAVIPWGYVWRRFVAAPGETWGRAAD